MSQLEHLVKFTSGKSLSDSKRRLLGLIKEPYVWAADPRGFNDPFEFKVPVRWSDEDTHLRARYFADNPIGEEPAFLAWKRGLTRNFKWSYAMNTRAALLDSLGVCCFTRRVQNQLFWSHYANSQISKAPRREDMGNVRSTRQIRSLSHRCEGWRNGNDLVLLGLLA